MSNNSSCVGDAMAQGAQQELQDAEDDAQPPAAVLRSDERADDSEDAAHDEVPRNEDSKDQ
jgi:hypothetical protein